MARGVNDTPVPPAFSPHRFLPVGFVAWFVAFAQVALLALTFRA